MGFNQVADRQTHIEATEGVEILVLQNDLFFHVFH